MCTVVCEWSAGSPVRLLALRDELTTRAFDLPDAWWDEHPGVVGGRDRAAGGSWCVTDVASGTTALVLNRAERRAGTPSRGLLPLAALTHGADWSRTLDHTTMASFTLMLVAPDALTAWTWDAERLTRAELPAGRHMITPNGVDPGDARARRFGPALADPADWPEVLGACRPEDDHSALVVRHEFEQGVYATVFGQIMMVTPGRLELDCTRTPWERGSWARRAWGAAGGAQPRRDSTAS